MRGERAGSLHHPTRHQPGCNAEGRLAGGQRNSRDCSEVSEKAPGMAKSCRAGEEFWKEESTEKASNSAHGLPARALGRFQAAAKHRSQLLQQENETPGVEFRNPKAFHSQQTVTLNRRWQGQDT